MRDDAHSRTAEAAAAVRAWHMLAPGEHVFEDPWAVRLLGPAFRFRVTNSVVRWLTRRLLGDLGPMVLGQTNLRSRYAEDMLERAIHDGVDQYVILAAGLDSFALRRPELVERLRVFEVDHPATQAFKRARVEALGKRLPARVELAPVDFEREGVIEGLARTSHARDRPSFVSWLGTVPYLSEDAIFGTLDALARVLATGSQVVFDFGGPIEGLDAEDRRALEKLRRFTARRGEPLRTYGPVEPFLERVQACGFETAELLPPAEQEHRYLHRVPGGLRTLPTAYLVRLRRT